MAFIKLGFHGAQNSFGFVTASAMKETIGVQWSDPCCPPLGPGAARLPLRCDSPASSYDAGCRQFFDSHPRITGIDLTCPHLLLVAQLLWLRATFALIDLLAFHFHISCFVLVVHLPADLDCGTSLSDTLLSWPHSDWSLQMGPTSSSLFDDAVHARRWICLGLKLPVSA
jgi:hypothetical protein